MTSTASDFPIQFPDKLPTLIDPCPIFETVLEVRYVTSEDWSEIPGLLYQFIREKYPNKKPLEIDQIPPEIRRTIPEFTYKPLRRFESEQFNLHIGPRVFSLLSKRKNYPGWTAIKDEFQWLLDCLDKTGIVVEGERLGLRYIDIFKENIFDIIQLDVGIQGSPVASSQLQFGTEFNISPFQCRLLLNNGVNIKEGNEINKGSAFDLDIWLSADQFDLFNNGLDRFTEAHTLNKKIFFGLLQDDYLHQLNPQYL